MLRKTHEDDKLGILDVRILLNNAAEIDIEIQVAKLDVWTERSLFYTAKMYVDQEEKGGNYDNFKKCISISILDFVFFEDYDGFYSGFHLREDTRHTIYTDKMEFHVIELPKLPEELQDNTNELLLWAKFFAAEREEEFEMLAERDEYIASAYSQLQVISQDKQKRLEYEAREKAIKDHNQYLLEAKRHGRAEGLAEGSIKKLISLICKKLRKHKTIEEIADHLEEDVETIEPICRLAEQFAPEYDEQKVLEQYLASQTAK